MSVWHSRVLIRHVPVAVLEGLPRDVAESAVAVLQRLAPKQGHRWSSEGCPASDLRGGPHPAVAHQPASGRRARIAVCPLGFGKQACPRSPPLRTTPSALLVGRVHDGSSLLADAPRPSPALASERPSSTASPSAATSSRPEPTPTDSRPPAPAPYSSCPSAAPAPGVGSVGREVVGAGGARGPEGVPPCHRVLELLALPGGPVWVSLCRTSRPRVYPALDPGRGEQILSPCVEPLP